MSEVKVRKRKERVELKSRMTNLLMFLPNLILLCVNLLGDKRVPLTEKALFIGAIVYAISPLDFIPDVLPFIGQIDDIYLIALTLLRLLNFTDERVLREHWKGGGDIVALADSVAKLAPILLPKRVSRVLTNRVQLAEAGKILNAVTKRNEKLVIEIPNEPLIEAKSEGLK